MDKFEALKTICGAIHYTLLTYNEKGISDYEWKFLCSYIEELEAKTLYKLEVFQDGFLLTTDKISLRYFHHEMHAQREIELKKNE